MFGFGASPVVEAGLGFTPFAGVARCSSVCSVDSGLHALVVSAPGSGVFLLCGLIAAFLLASAGGSLTGGPSFASFGAVPLDWVSRIAGRVWFSNPVILVPFSECKARVSTGGDSAYPDLANPVG